MNKIEVSSVPEKISGAYLWRLQAKNFPIGEWFGLWLENPMEDANYQDGRCIEKKEDKIIFRFGSWIETQEFEPDEWIVMTWFNWKIEENI